MLDQAHKDKDTPTEVVSNYNDTVAINSGNNKVSLLVNVEQTFNLTDKIKKAYQTDELYSKILENPKAHTLFRNRDSLVFTKNLLKRC